MDRAPELHISWRRNRCHHSHFTEEESESGEAQQFALPHLTGSCGQGQWRQQMRQACLLPLRVLDRWAFLSQKHLTEPLILLDRAHCPWDPATSSYPVGFIYWAQDSPHLHWLLAWKWTGIKSEPMGEGNLPRLLGRDLAVSLTLHQ